MKHRNDLPRAVVCHEDIGIVMEDGTRLSARIWLPEDAEARPVPAILEHLPYRKRDGTIARDSLTMPYYAGHGYAAIRVDMRGNGDSEGLMEDEYTQQELDDACAVIAWARAQPWCTGKVGMQGISWGGFNSLQVAALQPEGLEAIITICSTVDRFADDIHVKGGCQLGAHIAWATQMLAYSSRPPDPEIAGDNRWRDLWLDRLDTQPFLFETWIKHQRRDEYWRHGSVCEDYGAIRAAVLSIGGWHDGYRNTIAHLVENLSAQGTPVKGIVGPWNHKYPHIAAPEPRIGFLQEALRWWDHWLKGAETGVEDDPAMRLWLMDSVRPKAKLDRRPGRWIAEAAWPSPGIARTVMHMGSEGMSPEPGRADVRVASPADCGGCGGVFFPAHYGAELPTDQRDDDARSACFDGVTLTEPQDIVGAPRVALTLVSDRPQAQLCVRLCDVFPDGTSALITMGVLNLTHREGAQSPQPMIPGEVTRVAFDLDQIAYRVPAGHRIRVAVSTAYWPFIWPAPDAATLQIHTGEIALPVRSPASRDEWRFEEPAGAAAWDAESLRRARYSRVRETDLTSGNVVMKVGIDGGEARDRAHGLITSTRSEERWTIHPDDPNSARSEIAWVTQMGRDAWQVRTACDTVLSADAAHWRWKARLRCWEDGALVFETAWDGSADRDEV
ncbi:MAG: CocE/NonD family hydrolase [Pseudomonadota bacterium]